MRRVTVEAEGAARPQAVAARCGRAERAVLEPAVPASPVRVDRHIEAAAVAEGVVRAVVVLQVVAVLVVAVVDVVAADVVVDVLSHGLAVDDHSGGDVHPIAVHPEPVLDVVLAGHLLGHVVVLLVAGGEAAALCVPDAVVVVLDASGAAVDVGRRKGLAPKGQGVGRDELPVDEVAHGVFGRGVGACEDVLGWHVAAGRGAGAVLRVYAPAPAAAGGALEAVGGVVGELLAVDLCPVHDVVDGKGERPPLRAVGDGGHAGRFERGALAVGEVVGAEARRLPAVAEADDGGVERQLLGRSLVEGGEARAACGGTRVEGAALCTALPAVAGELVALRGAVAPLLEALLGQAYRAVAVPALVVDRAARIARPSPLEHTAIGVELELLLRPAQAAQDRAVRVAVDIACLHLEAFVRVGGGGGDPDGGQVHRCPQVACACCAVAKLVGGVAAVGGAAAVLPPVHAVEAVIAAVVAHTPAVDGAEGHLRGLLALPAQRDVQDAVEVGFRLAQGPVV